MGIRDIARGERADRDASEQIADDRRDAEASRGEAAGKGERQPDGDGRKSVTSRGTQPGRMARNRRRT